MAIIDSLANYERGLTNSRDLADLRSIYLTYNNDNIVLMLQLCKIVSNLTGTMI